jgi:hypothetical protein
MDHRIDSCDQRRLRRLLVPFLLPLLFLLVLVSTSQAANGHGLTNTFGSETSTVKDPEPLSKPTAIAWGAATNEIYVLDSGHDAIARFNAAGEPEGEFTGEKTPAKAFSVPNSIVVDNDLGSLSYGDVYVADEGNGAVDKFGPEGKYINQLTGTCPAQDESQAAGICEPSNAAVTPFGELRGVAVDPSGNLWVETESGPFDEFNDASVNGFVLSDAAEFPEGPGFAVDSKGNIYFVYSFFHNAFRWVPGVEFEFFAGTQGCGCVTGIALDQTTGPTLDGVYVDQGTSVAQYAPDPPVEEPPVKPEVFGSSALAEGSGIAVSSAHTVYVADTKTGDVDVFAEGAKPVPTAEKTGVVEGTSATLEGNLAGDESRYHFAYNTGSTCVGGQTTPTVTSTVSSTVSTEVTGLVAKTEYTFCLIAENTYGAESGAPITFTTTASKPVIEKTSSSVQGAEATLEATVNPELEPTTCVVQYGITQSYGQETKCAPETLSAEGIGLPVTAALEGLVPDTTYDYRILATNGTGTRQGPNETFTTEVIPPTDVETAPASDLTPTTAQLGGQANPGGSATYYIEYGAPTCSLNGIPNFAWWLCATKTAEAGPLSGDSTQAVAPIEVTGLTPGTTYRYWIVAHNANGSERGEEALFTTPTAGAPAAAGSTTTTPAPAVVTAPKALVPPPPPKRTTVTRAQKLAKALQACKKKPKRSRFSCEKTARKTYAPTKNTRTSKKKGSH